MAPATSPGPGRRSKAFRGARPGSRPSVRPSAEPLSSVTSIVAVCSEQSARGASDSAASAAARIRGAHCQAAQVEKQQRLKDFQRQCQRRVSQQRSAHRSAVDVPATSGGVKPVTPLRYSAVTLQEFPEPADSLPSCEHGEVMSDHVEILVPLPAGEKSASRLCLADLIASASDSRTEAMCRLGLRTPIQPRASAASPFTLEQDARGGVERNACAAGEEILVNGKVGYRSAPSSGSASRRHPEPATTAAPFGVAELSSSSKAAHKDPQRSATDNVTAPVQTAHKNRQRSATATASTRTTGLGAAESNSSPRKPQKAPRSSAAVTAAAPSRTAHRSRQHSEDVPIKRKSRTSSVPAPVLPPRQQPEISNATMAASKTVLNAVEGSRSLGAPSEAWRDQAGVFHSVDEMRTSAFGGEDVPSSGSASGPGSLSSGGEKSMRYTSGLLSLLLKEYAKCGRPPPALCACVHQPTNLPPPKMECDGHLSQAPAWEAYVQRVSNPSSHARNCEFSHNLSRLQKQVLILIQGAKDPSKPCHVNLLSQASSTTSLEYTFAKPQSSAPLVASLTESEYRIQECVQYILREYPEKKVCLLGGRLVGGDAEFLPPYLQAFAEALTNDHPTVRLFTGSRPGIQQCFVERSLGLLPPVINLLPKGVQNELPPSAVILDAGNTEEEKMEIFGQIGDIYITMAGGPGVTHEANLAAARGAKVVPLAFSGAASAELTPSHPDMATSGQWETLSNRESSPEAIAQILIGMIRGVAD